MGYSPKGDTYNNDGEGVPLLNGPTEFGPHSPHVTLFTTAPSRFSGRGDILFCVRGSTTGRMNWADKRYAVGRGIAAIRAKTNVEDTYFIYCCIREFMQRLLSLTSGSVFPNLSTGDINGFEIPWPEKPVRGSIVYILRTLDDKIELNRRMNRTLEKMAAAVFKSWFIDFDPVRAKAEGHDPNLPKKIAALFSDSFEESELGDVPKGWRVGPLTEIAILQTKTVQPSKQPDTLWEHYSIPAFDEGRQPKWERGDTIKSGKYAVPHVCVLASKLNPQFPRVWLPEVTNVETAICSTEFMPFVPIQGYWRPYLYELLKSSTIQEGILARVSGSTGSRQRVKPKDIAVMTVVIPPHDVINTFCSLIEGLHRKLLANRRNSLTLSRTRDQLLPKLLSGELTVPDAATFTEEMVR